MFDKDTTRFLNDLHSQFDRGNEVPFLNKLEQAQETKSKWDKDRQKQAELEAKKKKELEEYSMFGANSELAKRTNKSIMEGENLKSYLQQINERNEKEREAYNNLFDPGREEKAEKLNTLENLLYTDMAKKEAIDEKVKTSTGEELAAAKEEQAKLEESIAFYNKEISTLQDN